MRYLRQTTNIGHLKQNLDELMKSNIQTNCCCQTVVVRKKKKKKKNLAIAFEMKMIQNTPNVYLSREELRSRSLKETVN